MANAHAHRHRSLGAPCKTDCPYCKANNTQRKAQKLPRVKNSVGHRTKKRRKAGGKKKEVSV